MTCIDGTEPTLAGLQGLWTRSLIQWPDGRRDVTTAVHWLQAPSLYIDLRQPAGRPDFSATRALAEVDEAQIAWLVRQEGFAGRLRHADGWFEWGRTIDFQPQAVYSDCGSLRYTSDRMIEVGRDIPYVEHWHRAEVGDVVRAAAARLVDVDSGRVAALARVGDVFMLAVDRPAALPALPDLASCVAAAADRAARLALLDCELAVGRIVQGHWQLAHSSLPWREGRALSPRRAGPDLIELGDATGHCYRLEELEGEPALLGL